MRSRLKIVIPLLLWIGIILVAGYQITKSTSSSSSEPVGSDTVWIESPKVDTILYIPISEVEAVNSIDLEDSIKALRHSLLIAQSIEDNVSDSANTLANLVLLYKDSLNSRPPTDTITKYIMVDYFSRKSYKREYSDSLLTAVVKFNIQRNKLETFNLQYTVKERQITNIIEQKRWQLYAGLSAGESMGPSVFYIPKSQKFIINYAYHMNRIHLFSGGFKIR